MKDPCPRLDLISSPMPDVKDLDFTPALGNAIDDTIHMWFAPVKKVAKTFVLGRPRAPQRIGFQS